MQIKVKISKILEQITLLLVLALVFLYDPFVETIGYLDEFTAFLSFLVLFFFIAVKGKLKLFRKEYYIALLLMVIMIIGLISNAVAYRNGHITDGFAIVADFINVFKAFVAYFAIRLLSNNYNAKRVIENVSKYAKSAFYILIFIILLDFLFNLFPHPPRYGIYAFELFFQHPSRFGFAFSFIFLAILPKHFNSNKGLLILVLLFGMLSLRVKYFGFVGLSVVFMFYGKRLFYIPKIYFYSIIIGIGIFFMWMFWDTIQMYFIFEKIEEAYSRAVILYYSYIIGNDFFPLGTGFGSYASFYSGYYYSWVYDLYGIDRVWGISRSHWNFVADQYWPMVFGQFGYLGLISMILVIYNYLTFFITMIKRNLNNYKYYYFLSAILGLLLLLIDSSSDAIFTQQRAVVMFVFFGLVVNITTQNNENTKKLN